MARIIYARIAVVILAMVHVGIGAVAVAAPTTTDHLPLDWPSAPGLDYENAKAQAFADQGLAAYLAGDFATAVSKFSELLKLKPVDARVFYNRGNVYYQMRDLERALADFSETLKIAPNMYLALMNRGNTYSQLKRYEEAIADYGKAITLKPDQFLIYFNRGIAFGRLGASAKALIDFTQAIRLNPKDALSYSSRGDVFYQQNDFESARKDYLKAVELDSSLAHAAERLRTLPVRFGSADTTAQVIDSSAIKAEIFHRQAIARLVRLAGQSCLQNGESEKGLAAIAADRNWSAVGDIELKKVSSRITTMVNGWTFSDEVGSVAIMQSKMNDAPGIYVCSMTAKVSSPHLIEDFRTEFEKQFKTEPASPVEQSGDTTLRYWLAHKSTCDAKTTIIMSHERGTVTVRMLHGRKADGA